MALSQALSTGITGLMSHQKAMDNVGNNLANVNTVGFKKGVFQFSTLLEQSLRGGMAADGTTGRGSINPIAMGMGAQTYSINKVFTQGSPETTNNPYDMMIDGNGFFVVKQENSYAYTRAGSFYKGADGSLMAGDGLYVQGTMATKGASGAMEIPPDVKLQNIIIPIGQVGGHSQTSEVAFTGNLDSRQKVSTGTKLYGGSVYPSPTSLQAWMDPDFNGGDRASDASVDTSWNSLQEVTYAAARSTINDFIANASGPVPEGVRGVSLYDNSQMTVFEPTDAKKTYQVVDIVTGQAYSAEELLGAGAKMFTMRDITALTAGRASADSPLYVPAIEQIKTINGGNVQTSAAYGIKVPDPLKAGTSVTMNDGTTVTINNSHTYPAWFYESTGAQMSFKDIAAMTDAADYNDTSGSTNVTLRAIWPNGVNNEGWPGQASDVLTSRNLPKKDEVYGASLNTPLENLWYQKGNTWVQPFSNIKNGDEITIAFRKGNSKVEASFTYNKPVGPEPTNGQISVNRQKSYTLEHLMKFLGGDVDEPTAAAQNISPAMFGFDEANPTADWDQEGYEAALKNVGMATDDSNMDATGGAMGLLSIPPQVSNSKYGTDEYDAPAESAGAYSRQGVQTVYYDRWDPATNEMVKVKGESFNMSFVSNLGTQNALSDIIMSFNHVSHDTMFSQEKEMNAAQGGAAMMTVEFYDSLGNPKEATLRLAMVDKNSDFTTWRWYADCVDDSDFEWAGDPETGDLISNLNVGTGLIRFDKNGNFVKGSDFSETNGITINQENMGVNDPIIIGITNGLGPSSTQSLDFSSFTCTAVGNSVKLEEQNGNPPGTLESFSVGLDGTIQGHYSNGETVVIARMALATIPNEHGLIAGGNNLYYAGPASGQAQISYAMLGGTGSIRYMTLESSNVDLSEEFTKLISVERGFQANSRTITTADEMITELLNLKR